MCVIFKLVLSKSSPGLFLRILASFHTFSFQSSYLKEKYALLPDTGL